MPRKKRASDSDTGFPWSPAAASARVKKKAHGNSGFNAWRKRGQTLKAKGRKK